MATSSQRALTRFTGLRMFFHGLPEIFLSGLPTPRRFAMREDSSRSRAARETTRAASRAPLVCRRCNGRVAVRFLLEPAMVDY